MLSECFLLLALFQFAISQVCKVEPINGPYSPNLNNATALVFQDKDIEVESSRAYCSYLSFVITALQDMPASNSILNYLGYTCWNVQNNACPQDPHSTFQIGGNTIPNVCEFNGQPTEMCAHPNSVPFFNSGISSGQTFVVYYPICTGFDATSNTERSDNKESFSLTVKSYLDGTALCEGFADFVVDETIQASANKVTLISVGPSDPVLGGTMTVTIEGNAGNPLWPGFYASPAISPNFPVSGFRLESYWIDFLSADNQLATLGHSHTGTIFFPEFNDGSSRWKKNPNYDYVMMYTYRIVHTTTANTPVFPLVTVQSGEDNYKHNPLDSDVYVEVIPPVQNHLTMTINVDKSCWDTEGENPISFSVGVNNAADQLVTLDSLVATITGASFTVNSVTIGGSAVSYVVDGSNIRVFGVELAGSSSKTVIFSLDFSSPSGSQIKFSAVSFIGSEQIDSTVDTSDNAPVEAVVNVEESCEQVTPVSAVYLSSNLQPLCVAPDSDNMVVLELSVKVTNNGNVDASVNLEATISNTGAGSATELPTQLWTQSGNVFSISTSVAKASSVTVVLRFSVNQAAASDSISTSVIGSANPGSVRVDTTEDVTDNAAPSTTQITVSADCGGDLPQCTSYTQGGWNAPPHGNNPATLLSQFWDHCKPEGGLVLSCPGGSSSDKYLTVGDLKEDLVVPHQMVRSQLIAASLNVIFSTCTYDMSAHPAAFQRCDLGSYCYADSLGACAGLTINQVLDYAQAFLYGCTCDHDVCTEGNLKQCLSTINENWHGGTENNGNFVYCPLGEANSVIPPIITKASTASMISFAMLLLIVAALLF